MDRLKQMLAVGECLGVARSADGVVKLFHRRGVADLLELSEKWPQFLNDASIADKVVGRGAALLLVRGHIASVYACVISSGALDVLRRNGIAIEFDTEVPFIVNRRGDGVCPVESLTSDTDNPDEAYKRIKTFINEQKNNHE